MKLDKKIVNIILSDGSYYKNNFNSKAKEIIIDKETFDWFENTMNVDKDNLAFIEFYSFVATPPVGNNIYLLPLEEIEKNGSLLLIGNDELGLLIYDSSSDMVYCYDFDSENESVFYLEEIRDNFIKSFNSFEDFLKNYYELDI